MSYTLDYTAEQINSRLALISENKNLLPHPYNYLTNLPLWLEDVGDGSFLTHTSVPATASAAAIKLAAFSLPAGIYTTSVEVTEAINTSDTTSYSGFGLKITGSNVTSNTNGQFTMTVPGTIYVTLEIPGGGFPAGLLIKPQIEAGAKKTAWVPYMDTIGNYVDRRFNSTNAKIKTIADTVAPSTTLAQLGLKTEIWTFELETGEIVEKSVVVAVDSE